MSDNTKIEWTDATWNPITGCTVVSAGCKNCYAMKLAGTRLKHHPSRAGLTIDTGNGPVWNGEVRFNRDWLDQPLKWQRPRMIFVCAHGDLFHESVPDEWIDKVFAVMALSRRHTFQVLTKRPERMRIYLGNPQLDIRLSDIMDDEWRDSRRGEPIVSLPLNNVWLGVSVENQEAAHERIPHLLSTPATVRWISAEPLLGPVDLSLWFDCDGFTGCADDGVKGLHWVVAGGESGQRARPMHPDWARSLRDQCEAADVPFLFKQWGEFIVPEDGDQACRVCGCTWDNACSGGCYWAENDLCSACVGMEEPSGDRPVKHIRVGKKAAGRILDGMEHDAYPEPRT